MSRQSAGMPILTRFSSKRCGCAPPLSGQIAELHDHYGADVYSTAREA
jgi:hypothetical protein